MASRGWEVGGTENVLEGRCRNNQFLTQEKEQPGAMPQPRTLERLTHCNRAGK